MADAIAGFAGAIHRRRRLMSPEDRATYDDLLLEYGIQPPPATDDPEPVILQRDKLLHRIVSERLWKNLLLLAPIILLPFFVLLQGILSGESLAVESAADQIALRQNQRTLFGCVGLQLLLAGQASLIVAIVRSWSARDFAGRYRAYRLSGILLAIVGVIGITVGYAHVTELIALILRPFIGAVESSQKALILVAVCGTVIFLFMSVVPDMGRNRISQLLLSIGILAMLVTVLDSISSSWHLLPVVVRLALLFVGSGMTVASLVLHCRFVTYVCNDPPVRKAAGTRSESNSVAVVTSGSETSEDQSPPLAGDGNSASDAVVDRSPRFTPAAEAVESAPAATQSLVTEDRTSSSRNGASAKAAKEKKKTERKKAA